MKIQLKGSRGFTLVDLVIAILLGLILLAAVWTAVWSGQRSSVGIERKVMTNQDARAALDVMASEIRMASFNSLFTANIWRNPSDCSVSTAQNYRGIQVATATSITIEMDIDADGTCGNGAEEIISYEYDAANLRLNREVITCTAGVRSPTALLSFLGPIAGQPNIRTVEVINGALPVFRYFDGTGTLIDYANLPNDIPRIRRIEIVLLVRSADTDPSTGQSRQMAYSTSVLPRNHGILF
jgi:type II secretory pathway pseudopilin PulG